MTAECPACLVGTRDECQADKDDVSLEDHLDVEAEPCACSCHDDQDGEGRTT